MSIIKEHSYLKDCFILTKSTAARGANGLDTHLSCTPEGTGDARPPLRRTTFIAEYKPPVSVRLQLHILSSKHHTFTLLISVIIIRGC